MRANWSRHTAVCAVAVLFAVLGACGSSTDQAVRSQSDTVESVETILPDASTPPAQPTETTAPAEATALEQTETSPPAVTTPAPGDECFGLCPRQGDMLGVVGIAFDEVLTLRAAPSPDGRVVGTLPPLTEVVATGANRAAWYEVTAAGLTGWAPRGSLLALGGTFDVTATVVDSYGGTPRATSMLELGRIVTDAVVPCDPATPTTIVVAVAPTPGPLSEVVYDTFTGELCGGDSVAGARIRVTGRQVEDELPATSFARAVVYELVGAESRIFCWRGSDGTSCV